MTIEQALPAFVVAAGLLTITPGLDTALVLRTAAVEGPRCAMFAGVGICAGCLTWGFAASAGLGALLSVSSIAYSILKIVGAGYLIFLGAQLLRHRPFSVSSLGEILPASAHASHDRVSTTRWFMRGFLTNLLNPKVGVFYVTFLPQFIPSEVHVVLFSMLLTAIHATQGILWFSVLTLATRPLTAWLRRPRVARALDQVTGAVLVGFGLKLIIDKRR